MKITYRGRVNCAGYGFMPGVEIRQDLRNGLSYLCLNARIGSHLLWHEILSAHRPEEEVRGMPVYKGP